MEKLKDAEQEATGHVVEEDANKETQGATGSAATAEKLDSDPRVHTVVQDNETAYVTRSEETQAAGVKTAGDKNDDAHGEIQTAETRDAAAEQLASDLQEKDTAQDHDAPTTQLQNMLLKEEETHRRDDEDKLKREAEEGSEVQASRHQEGKSANREDHCPSDPIFEERTTKVIHTKDEQKMPTHEKDKQAGSERQIISRSTEEEEGGEEMTEQVTSNFSQERERTLSANKEQQVETKNPKSLGRQGAQQEGQHSDASSRRASAVSVPLGGMEVD